MPRPQAPSRRLSDLRDTMLETLDEMRQVVKDAPNCDHMMSRVDSYWYAQLKSILTKESGYLGGSMHDVQDTIDDLEEEEQIEE